MTSCTILLSLALFCLFSLSFHSCLRPRNNNNPTLAYISRPSVNLRASPKDPLPGFQYDALQNTQLLLGDRIKIIGQRSKDWYEVRALDQMRFSNHTWHPYDGFLRSTEFWLENESSRAVIESSAAAADVFAIVQAKRAEIFSEPCFHPGCLHPSQEVSLGTIFRFVNEKTAPLGWLQVGTEDGAHQWYIRSADVEVVSGLHDGFEYPFVLKTPEEEHQMRRAIMDKSFSLIGSVYFWGGRSSYDWKMFESQHILSGIDCSGLVGLSYQAKGFILPRDAHDMYLKADKIERNQLQGGDLFFFEKPSTNRVVHVMMMLDETYIVESTSAVNASRVVTIEERFGSKFSELQYGQMVADDSYRLYWGRFLTNSRQQ